MKCLCSGEQLRAATSEEMALSSESFMTKDLSPSAYSTQVYESEPKLDGGNIEEAELSLRANGSLNNEEARAVLGRLEYQKGNIEAALRVFEGIDIAAMIPKMKASLSKKGGRRKKNMPKDADSQMSIHAVNLFLEAIFLKAKSSQGLGKFKEAAQSCKFILDILESSFPDGLPENFGADCKLQETLSNAVELLPELWKLALASREAILSYRRALLYDWVLDAQTVARIQKEFAIFLLYSGSEVCPPNLRSQMASSFVPKNNFEEAILLLMILLRKASMKKIAWDPSILDHLSYALSLSGDLRALANQIEELLPGMVDRTERYYILSLCYYAEGEDLTALNLLKKLLNSRESPEHLPALMLASKICTEILVLGEDFARRALDSSRNFCNELEGVASCLLGLSLTPYSQSAISDSERLRNQHEALEALEASGRMTRLRDPSIVYHISIENAVQRKLDSALSYARHLLRLDMGSNVKGWLLLAQILSAKKQYRDAETVIDAALEQTSKWDQRELLRLKAKLYNVQGQLKKAVDTYTQLLAILQAQNNEFECVEKGKLKDTRILEMETWHDLAYLYMALSRWRDADVCLAKSKAFNPHSAPTCHAYGKLYEAKGLLQEALVAFMNALDIDPAHVPSLISVASVLRLLGNRSAAVMRGFLMEALRLDRMNHFAWFNLGLLYSSGGIGSSAEAAECFQAAVALEETAPIEPFK